MIIINRKTRENYSSNVFMRACACVCVSTLNTLPALRPTRPTSRRRRWWSTENAAALHQPEESSHLVASRLASAWRSTKAARLGGSRGVLVFVAVGLGWPSCGAERTSCELSLPIVEVDFRNEWHPPCAAWHPHACHVVDSIGPWATAARGRRAAALGTCAAGREGGVCWRRVSRWQMVRQLLQAVVAFGGLGLWQATTRLGAWLGVGVAVVVIVVLVGCRRLLLPLLPLLLLLLPLLALLLLLLLLLSSKACFGHMMMLPHATCHMLFAA